MKFNEKYITHSENETKDLGFKFAENLVIGDIVAFYGELGSGKTEFIKGICRFFQIEENITSPTFTIINRYNGFLKNENLQVYHIDLYRIKSQAELTEIGFSECIFDSDCIKLIEWAERTDIYPENIYSIRIVLDNNDESFRKIIIQK